MWYLSCAKKYPFDDTWFQYAKSLSMILNQQAGEIVIDPNDLIPTSATIEKLSKQEKEQSVDSMASMFRMFAVKK